MVQTFSLFDAPTGTDAIAVEALRRIQAGFFFRGHPYDYDDLSQRRITGSAALAGFAISLNGKLPGDYYWDDTGEEFFWIAQDNAIVPMDAQTCLALGASAAAWEREHVKIAKTLKIRIRNGEDIGDFADDTLWPKRAATYQTS